MHPFGQDNLVPCFTLRSRREVNTVDAINSRLTEQWQNDSPSLLNAHRGPVPHMDMNALPSRLYRENMQSAQPYVIPGTGDSQSMELDKKVSESLATIQSLGLKLSQGRDAATTSTLKGQIETQQELYKLLISQQKMVQVDSLSQNPYFEKYDVAGDSRNIVRELRGSVKEDIVDKGLRESQKLLRRELESRWLPAQWAEKSGIDSLSAYDLMRPKFNEQGRNYR
jgi:hypothetical protein